MEGRKVRITNLRMLQAPYENKFSKDIYTNQIIDDDKDRPGLPQTDRDAVCHENKDNTVYIGQVFLLIHAATRLIIFPQVKWNLSL